MMEIANLELRSPAITEYQAPQVMEVVMAHKSEALELSLTIWLAKFNHQRDLSCPLEARTIDPGEYKRQRSPAVGSANDSSGKGRVKRRPPDVRLTEVPASQRS
jgi:hypothetical protein